MAAVLRRQLKTHLKRLRAPLRSRAPGPSAPLRRRRRLTFPRMTVPRRLLPRRGRLATLWLRLPRRIRPRTIDRNGRPRRPRCRRRLLRHRLHLPLPPKAVGQGRWPLQLVEGISPRPLLPTTQVPFRSPKEMGLRRRPLLLVGASSLRPQQPATLALPPSPGTSQAAALRILLPRVSSGLPLPRTRGAHLPTRTSSICFQGSHRLRRTRLLSSMANACAVLSSVMICATSSSCLAGIFAPLTTPANFTDWQSDVLARVCPNVVRRIVPTSLKHVPRTVTSPLGGQGIDSLRRFQPLWVHAAVCPRA